jgi:hypothetical protein
MTISALKGFRRAAMRKTAQIAYKIQHSAMRVNDERKDFMKTIKKANILFPLIALLLVSVSAPLRAEITRPSGYTPGFAVVGWHDPDQRTEKTANVTATLFDMLRSALPESGRRLVAKEEVYEFIYGPEVLTERISVDNANNRAWAMVIHVDYVFHVTLNPIGDDHSVVIRLYQFKDSGRTFTIGNTRTEFITSELVFSSRHFLGGSSENIYNGVNAIIDTVLQKLDELGI